LSNQTLAEVLRGQISQLEKLKVVAELNAREKALEQREIGLEVTLLKAELESEKSKSEFGFNVALGLVRNSVFRKALLIAKHCLQYRNGNYNTPQNTFQNSNETTTEE
jgi:hypothetical protein